MIDIRLLDLVRVNRYIEAGRGYVIQGFVCVRHMSEFWIGVSGAQWHPSRGHCPTWDDATECRCMLGSDA